jgi:hypothetical protein
VRALCRWVGAVVTLGLCGCGGGDIEGPPPATLVGTWHATRFEYVSKSGLGSAEVVGRGWTATLVLNADQTGELSATPQGLDPWSWAGAWEVAGDLFRIAGQGADVQLEGNTLRLTGFDGAYDFDADGTADPAKFNLVLTK